MQDEFHFAKHAELWERDRNKNPKQNNSWNRITSTPCNENICELLLK